MQWSLLESLLMTPGSTSTRNSFPFPWFVNVPVYPLYRGSRSTESSLVGGCGKGANESLPGANAHRSERIDGDRHSQVRWRFFLKGPMTNQFSWEWRSPSILSRWYIPYCNFLRWKANKTTLFFSGILRLAASKLRYIIYRYLCSWSSAHSRMDFGEWLWMYMMIHGYRRWYMMIHDGIIPIYLCLYVYIYMLHIIYVHTYAYVQCVYCSVLMCLEYTKMASAGTHEMPSSVNIHSLMHMYDLVQPLTQLRLVHAAAYLYMLDTCSVGEGFPWKFTAMASTGFKELRAPPMLGLRNWISMYIPKIHHWWHYWIFQLHMKQWRGETPSIQCKKHTKAILHARSLTARPSTNDTWKVPMFLLKWFLFRRTKSCPF